VTGDDLASRMWLELSEIGVDMTRFPTAGHLVSWAKYAPKAKQSAGKSNPGHHRQGQPLDRQHPRRGRHRRRPHQDLPRLPLPPPRPPPRQTARPGRGRQLHPHHRLVPAVGPRSPLHRPRPRLARPARPDPPQAPARRRTGTPLREEGHPPGHRRLTSRPIQTRLRCAPLGAAARPATVSTDFRFRRVGARGSKDVSALSGVGNPGFNPPSVRPSWIDMHRHPAPRMRASAA
jgi:Transposase IS116/IS110/IS902 family